MMMIRAPCWSSWHYDDHPGMALWWSSWYGICCSSHKEKMMSFFESITLMAFKVAKPQQSAKPNCYRYVITLLPSNSQTVSRHSTPLPLLPSWMLSQSYAILDVNHCLVTDCSQYWLVQEMFNVQSQDMHYVIWKSCLFRSSCSHLKRVCNFGSFGVFCFFNFVHSFACIACVSRLT